jgi:hypothetical protein
MSGARLRLATIWRSLNPREPTPLYIVKFMSVAVGLFVAACVIGRL